MNRPSKQRLKLRLLLDQDFLCRYCGRRMNVTLPVNDLFATFDHRQPISKGGRDTPDNLVLACSRCNRGKRSDTEESFLRKLPS